MKTKHTRQQIQDTISYWQNVLNEMNLMSESSSSLLDALAREFGTDTVFNIVSKISVNDSLAKNIFNSLNKHFFNQTLPIIPVSYMSYDEIIDELKKRDSYQFPSKDNLLGVHSVLMENDPDKVQLDTKLNLHSDIIMINKDKLNNKTFIFNVATICHEMIHHFDKNFGQYQNMVKIECMIKQKIDSHSTQTFQHYMKLANEDGLKVIENMCTSDENALDYDAAEKLLSSIYENDDEKSNNEDSLSSTHIAFSGKIPTSINLIN